jgi:hypothetical protein
LRFNPTIRYFPNLPVHSIASALLAAILLATPAFGQEPPLKLSDVGNWVVVVFGLLLWVCCLFGLFALGMRAIFNGHHTRTKQKHRKLPKPHITAG